MPDHKPKKAYSHSEELSADDHPEIAHFAKRHRLSTEQVHHLMEEHGNDRVRLEHAASKLLESDDNVAADLDQGELSAQ